ncbi:MAG: mannonate dehydratase [Clostridium sp.]
MKLGIGLYNHMLNNDHFDFAKQCGCTDLVVHLANYYDKDKIVMATNDKVNYGMSKSLDPIWEVDNINRLVKATGEKGLNISAIENFSPADWYDILLDGPEKHQQMENLKRIITNVGKAGIKNFGYNFSFAGVWGHIKINNGRGNAESTAFDASALDLDARIPNGEIWNMTYKENLENGFIKDIDQVELWQRLEWFLQNILPVAEEAGVLMALHPDDPPMPVLRKTPRLVYQPAIYQKVLDLVPSKSNGIEFCMGSIQEMTEGNIYDAIEQYADKISYVHVRNVIGKVPNYREVFVDEGDIDITRALGLLQKHDFKGVLIPDHTPQMTCDAGWHAGMAYALGYIKAVMQHLGINE